MDEKTIDDFIPKQITHCDKALTYRHHADQATGVCSQLQVAHVRILQALHLSRGLGVFIGVRSLLTTFQNVAGAIAEDAARTALSSAECAEIEAAKCSGEDADIAKIHARGARAAYSSAIKCVRLIREEES